MHHPALILNVTLNDTNNINFDNNSSSKAYNFKKANYPDLYNALLSIDWSFLSNIDDVNRAIGSEFYVVLYSLLDQYVPTYKKLSKNKPKYPKWYTIEIKNNITLKNKYRLKYKNDKNEQYLQEFKRLRTVIKTQINIAYKNYLNNVQNSVITNPSNFWHFIQNKRDPTRIPGLLTHEGTTYDSPESIVNGFGKFFSSVYLSSSDRVTNNNNTYKDVPCFNISDLTEEEIISATKKLKNKMTSGHDKIPSFFVKDCAYALVQPLLTIYNLSLKTAVFPDCWKLTRLCPIFKSGNTSDISNYRAIAILCNFAKVFEISLYARIYPSIKSLISPFQHGFMEMRSTATNLCLLTQFISEVLDSQGQVDVIYTDFSKAFDRIDHELLLSKLNMFGFSCHFIEFLRSYLYNRKQYVMYYGHESELFTATSGVPQGSNLGPLLFLLFINDLINKVQCDKLLFADDMKIYAKIGSVDDCENILAQLKIVEDWCNQNILHLNASKCKVVSYTRKSNPVVFDYSLNSQILERSVTIKDLGVIFDQKFTFSNHVAQVTSSALKMLGFIVRNCHLFSNEFALKTLYYSYVRSKLEYCSIVWYPHYTCHKNAIENVQRRFLKFLSLKINGFYPERGYQHSLLLDEFNLTSLELRRAINSLKMLYNLLHNKLDSSLLLGMLSFQVPRITSRQTHTFYCNTPRTNVLLRSPVYIMCNNFNKISNVCDINCSTFSEITNSFNLIFAAINS